jgi:hypothetical protein
MSHAVRFLGLIVSSLLLLFIPAVAASVIAIRRGIRDSLDLLATSLITIGLVGYLAFWVYLASRPAGIVYSFTMFFSCSVIIIHAARKSRRYSLSLLRPLFIPALLVVFASIFLISLGYLHGGEDTPGDFAAYRFAPPKLAGDNTLPELFADAIIAGHIPRPLFADWLSSDRPPLQAGVLLYSYPLLPGSRELRYQILSAVLQCLAAAGLWMFLRACKCSDSIITIVLLVMLFSGFTFVNTFYTWPKLFPVAFLLVILTYLLTDRFTQFHQRARCGAVIGLAAALALLCHGGSMFALLGIGATVLVFRGYLTMRWLAGMAGTALFLYAPWSLYQRLYDPPGDRLIKWHLAGAFEPQPQASFSQLLFQNYRRTGIVDLVHFKRDNFKTLAGDLHATGSRVRVLLKHLVDEHTYARNAAAASLRRDIFYYWIPCIGPAALAPLFLPILLIAKGPRSALIAAMSMWLCIALILFIWCLLMFGPGTTVLHQGTYLTVVLAIAGAYLVFWEVHPVLASGLAFLQVALNAILFIWLTPTSEPGVGMISGAVNGTLAVFCLISAVACIAVLLFSAASGVGKRAATGKVYKARMS